MIPSPAIFREVTDSFLRRLRTWCDQRGMPWIEFPKGEREDDIVGRYRARFRGRGDVVLLGVAQERALGRTAGKTRKGRLVHFTFRRKAVCAP